MNQPKTSRAPGLRRRCAWGRRRALPGVWLGVGGLALALSTALGTQTAGCAADRSDVFVQTANGEQAAVSRFKTFGVLLPDSEELKENHLQPETFQRIAQLSIEEMKSRGYVPAPARDAELLLGFSPGLRLLGAVRVYDQNTSGRTDDVLSQQGSGEGRLTLSFVDTRAQHIVLTRVAQLRVSGALGEGQTRELVSRIFQGTPPAAR